MQAEGIAGGSIDGRQTTVCRVVGRDFVLGQGERRGRSIVVAHGNDIAVTIAFDEGSGGPQICLAIRKAEGMGRRRQDIEGICVGLP